MEEFWWKVGSTKKPQKHDMVVMNEYQNNIKGEDLNYIEIIKIRLTFKRQTKMHVPFVPVLHLWNCYFKKGNFCSFKRAKHDKKTKLK